MQTKTLHRLAWAAGLSFALLLTLTMVPGLNHEVKGPWGSGMVMGSKQSGDYFMLRCPPFTMGYSAVPQKDLKWLPNRQGFTRDQRGIYYQWGRCQFIAKRNNG
jgi:hypothetical protein